MSEALASGDPSREEFIAFLANLKQDFEDNRQNWANGDLSAYLEAMAAWAADMEGYYRNAGVDMADLSPWSIMADILLAARVYE